MKLDKKIIQIINSYLLKKIKISFTFLLTVSEKNLKLRLNKRKKLNRYDKFANSFYKRVQAGFNNQSKMNKKKYLIINSNNKVSENKNLITEEITSAAIAFPSPIRPSFSVVLPLIFI